MFKMQNVCYLNNGKAACFCMRAYAFFARGLILCSVETVIVLVYNRRPGWPFCCILPVRAPFIFLCNGRGEEPFLLNISKIFRTVQYFR